MKIAVILFPGNNCENETARAAEFAGMKAKILRWNTNEDISTYDGYILGGGFAYEDRIRAGIIAAQDEIMLKIKEEAEKGKPVLGICNGAQVLIETGMVPGLKDKVEMALAPNINPLVSGYYCTWIQLKSCQSVSIFNKILNNEIIKIPIAHGEGRFTTREKGLIEELIKNKQIAFQYCDSDGKVINKFPINPNSSINNIAGICNKKGNVMAMMPHPERASWMRQIPGFNGSFEQAESAAPARKILESMREYIKNE